MYNKAGDDLARTLGYVARLAFASGHTAQAVKQNPWINLYI